MHLSLGSGMKIVLFVVCHLFTLSRTQTAVNWCNLDTGYTTITTSDNTLRRVYISVTRDGSLWTRFEYEHKSQYENEQIQKLRQTILTPDAIATLSALNYTDWCVLTDVDLKVNIHTTLRPSWLSVFNPKLQRSKYIVLRKALRCDDDSSLNITLTSDKQGLRCAGGRKHSCGVRGSVHSERTRAGVFLQRLYVDPTPTADPQCMREKSAYSFSGSYYYAYVKLASCAIPKDSRILGHEAKLRPHVDTQMNAIIIPDPTQTALSKGRIKGWQLFVKTISPQHSVALQIWRPLTEDSYVLIAETRYHPVELRFQEILLRHSNVVVQKGDVLGLYFSAENPLPWTSVPCAYEKQRRQVVLSPRTAVKVGEAFVFSRASPAGDACRHYSFTAILANKTNEKLVEDWICPTAPEPTVVSEDLSADFEQSSHEDYGHKVELEVQSVTDLLPIHLVFIVTCSLLLLLIVIGFVSYYKALER